jgi:hypothetical protein
VAGRGRAYCEVEDTLLYRQELDIRFHMRTMLLNVAPRDTENKTDPSLPCDFQIQFDNAYMFPSLPIGRKPSSASLHTLFTPGLTEEADALIDHIHLQNQHPGCHTHVRRISLDTNASPAPSNPSSSSAQHRRAAQ